ncbi:endogenous retrovirus group 3 member 1 Env polyprotein-like [Mantella aurantiaca]
MYNSEENESLRTPKKSPPVKTPYSRTQTLKDIVTSASPTFEDTMAIKTGSSDTNLWLEWMRFSARQHNKSNCYVCGQARPHLGTVPLNIPKEGEECFLSLYTNTNSNHSTCEDWKRKYPILTKYSKLTEDITIYPGNYTCYSNYEGKGRFLGNFTKGYCANYSKVQKELVQNQTQSLGDSYWICGDRKIRSRLEGTWTGQCALAKIIMPLHILTDDSPEMTPIMTRKKRSVPGSFYPHVYIDAIGVPRGVPDEFKARDQVKAGFESLIPIITINKNVDWINYIYYNQQRFVNYTKDALKGIADQLGPTSTMTFQNRMALDMILAEKGGVCKMLEGPADLKCKNLYLLISSPPTSAVIVCMQDYFVLMRGLEAFGLGPGTAPVAGSGRRGYRRLGGVKRTHRRLKSHRWRVRMKIFERRRNRVARRAGFGVGTLLRDVRRG